MAKAAKVEKKKKDGPKRGKSSYMFFMDEQRSEILKKNPTFKVTEVAKAGGELWRKLSEKEKEKFVKLAEKDRKRYEEEKANLKTAKA